ncbi:MAG: hypothetical protein HOP29_02900 [Phycisphaerales bacterium]|nr:hypothetical protein [Phycisphaerales bacterium]
MRRFAINAIGITLAAAVVWWFTRHTAAVSTIAGARALHWIIGYPAPKLAADDHFLFWFAPLFPPLVGLVLASRWAPWPGRIVGLAIGLTAFGYIVSMLIAVVYSPYLTPSAVRAYLSQALTELNAVAVPVILWLIVVGPPSAARLRPPRDRAYRLGRATTRSLVLSIAFCGITTLPVWFAVEQSDRTIDSARNRLAASLTAEDYAGALLAMQDLMKSMGQTPALQTLYRECERRLGPAASDVHRTSPIQGLPRINR